MPGAGQLLCSLRSRGGTRPPGLLHHILPASPPPTPHNPTPPSRAQLPGLGPSPDLPPTRTPGESPSQTATAAQPQLVNQSAFCAPGPAAQSHSNPLPGHESGPAAGHCRDVGSSYGPSPTEPCPTRHFSSTYLPSDQVGNPHYYPSLNFFSLPANPKLGS